MFEGREWHGAAGARPEVLDELRVAARVTLPDSYFRLLSCSDGGEGPLPVDPFNLCLDPAKLVIDAVRARSHGDAEWGGFLIFGGNGGGEYLAFDLRNEPPWPVVTIDMVAGPESAEEVAPDFDAFVALVGLCPPPE